MDKQKKTQVIQFPGNLLAPLASYLKKEEKRLIKTKKSLIKEDPYATMNREDDNSVDADVAEQVDHERVSAVRTELSKSIINIRKTLTRIKIGKYGICERCHKMIDTDRLAIEPTAEYCVDCRKEIESQPKTKRGK